MNDVIEANIVVHTALSKHYNTDEPHFRPENQAKVKGRLQELAERAGNGRLLDVGCGTGFIIHLASDIFKKIDGVDITPAMMEQVDLSKGDITLTRTRAEDLPFADNSFDAASAYSFLDHLEDYRAVLTSVVRVLKTGGIFYVDLVPNREYWRTLANMPGDSLEGASEFVKREHRMVTANDKDIESKYGVDSETFRKMEPVKEKGGLDIDQLAKDAKACGFSQVDIHFDWFLGQAKVLHKQSAADADVVTAYLQEALPVTRNLFKYVWFTLTK
jgi:ubiquinone/menaquinone biosynthesis C-methylase UbiE